MRATARATTCFHSAAVRLPSPYLIAPGVTRGVTGRGVTSPMVVSHARPPRLASTTCGTTIIEPGARPSKVNEPNATGPDPGTRTSSSMLASRNSDAAHRRAQANRPGPGGTATLAASPHAASPSPRLIQT
jgi:hypothetical protein